jgi:hypothetical protein
MGMGFLFNKIYHRTNLIALFLEIRYLQDNCELRFLNFSVSTKGTSHINSNSVWENESFLKRILS